NSITGDTSINDGIVALGSAASIGSGNLTFTGVTTQLTPTQALTFTSSQAVTFNTATFTFNAGAPITFNGAPTLNDINIITNSNTSGTYFNGVIADPTTTNGTTLTAGQLSLLGAG